MYCPKCAAQNADDARFCRACGSDISLVPQALTGRMPVEVAVAEETERRDRRSRRRRHRGNEPPTVEDAVRSIFTGLAFMLIFICGLLFFRSGFFTWFWAAIPGLACLGDGVAKWIRLEREKERQVLAAADGRAAMPLSQPQRTSVLPPHDTAEVVMPPTSVTEGTTRHLDAKPAPPSSSQERWGG